MQQLKSLRYANYPAHALHNIRLLGKNNGEEKVHGSMAEEVV